MSSTEQLPPKPPTSLDWRAAGFRYFSYNFFLRQKFGHRVQKVSIDNPLFNVDGQQALECSSVLDKGDLFSAFAAYDGGPTPWQSLGTDDPAVLRVLSIERTDRLS